MILIKFHLLFCIWFFFSSLSSLPLYNFLSENTYFSLGHTAGKCVGSLNHGDESIKKPGILDLFLHLLFLQPTLHLGLMLLFCLLKLGYPDMLVETGGGGSWQYLFHSGFWSCKIIICIKHVSSSLHSQEQDKHGQCELRSAGWVSKKSDMNCSLNILSPLALTGHPHFRWWKLAEINLTQNIYLP